MSEDWAAVAKAINERVKELGWQQQELAARSHVSSAIVREIQRNTVNRNRSPRTLESLSVTLGWHPQHLKAILNGERPPAREEFTEQDLSIRLNTLEQRLDGISAQLATVIRLLSASQPPKDR